MKNHVWNAGTLPRPALIAFVAVFGLLLVGLPVAASEPEFTPDGAATVLMDLLNGERTERGLPALTIDPFLAAQARDGAIDCPNGDGTMEGRAKDMALHDFFSHDLRICGIDPVTAAPYNIFDVMYAWGYRPYYGENVAMNSGYGYSPYPYQFGCDVYEENCTGAVIQAPDTVGMAARQFMSSPGHRALALETRVDRFACGAWKTPAPKADHYYACIYASGPGTREPPAPTPSPTPTPTPTPSPETGAGAVYVPLAPARLLDSRIGNGLSGTLKTGVVRTFTVAGRGGVPADAVAVTGNLTVTGQTSAGVVSLGPTMSSSPTTSSLNAPRGDNRANGLTMRLSASGKLAAVWTGTPGSTTNLVFDVTGYFTETGAGAVYVPLAPARLLDSRIGNGLSGTLKTGVVRTFTVAGRGGVPADAVAVTGNLTVTGQTSAGVVSLGPTMSSSPTTSSLNAPRGDNRANGLTMRLSASGKLAAVWTGTPGSTTNLVFDVTGYFTETGAGAVYVPLAPARLLDSRIGNGLSGTLKTGVVRTFTVAGRGGVPADAVAVTGNLTVTGQTSAGVVSLGPTMSSSPTTSSLNAPRGDNRANGLTMRLSASGKLAAVWTGTPGSTTNLVFDVTGYFR